MDQAKVAVLLVDPYNDFLHEDGKLNSRLRQTLHKNDTILHLQQLVSTARNNEVPIYYCLHQQWTPELYQGWTRMSSSNSRQEVLHFFEQGSFGAQILSGLEPKVASGDVIVSRHFNSNAFYNTDLDYQLRQRNVTNLVLAGLTANTCLEATGRHAMECGYKVTVLFDATAAWSLELMDAAKNLVYPLFADEVILTQEWIEKYACLSPSL